MISVKKSFMLCAVVALLIPVMAVSAHAQAKANVVVKEWHIPSPYHLSGPLAGFAESHTWMTNKVIADINAEGGIAGRPVATEYCDSALDPTKASACVAKAIDSGALATNGPMADMEVRSVMPLVVRAQGPFVFSGTCTDVVAKKFFPWTIYVFPPTEENIRYQMELWYKHEPDIKSVVDIEEPVFPMVHTMLVGFLKTFDNLKVKTNGIVQAPSGAVDYDSVTVRALGTGANAFILGAIGPTCAKLVKGLVSRGVSPRHIYIMGGGFVGPEFLSEAKGTDEGIYAGSSPTYAANPIEAKMMKEYRDSHGGRPWGGLTTATYDMWHMIKAAVEHQGITGDPAKLKEERIKIKDYAINQKDFHGLDATYDVVNGLAVGSPQRLFQIHNDEAVLVEELRPKR
jgi:ABC-type branched-subunit amino acid transport system substrate-binding protein